MTFKTKFFTLVLFIGINISCEKWFCSDSCCGESFDPSYFSITGLEASLYSNKKDKAAEFDTLNWRNVFLYFDFQMDYYSAAKSKGPFLNFGNKAYACEPPSLGSNESKTEHFEKITVITLYDYNDNFKAKDTITHQVDLSLGGMENPSPYYFGNNLDLAAFGPYQCIQPNDIYIQGKIKPFQVKLIISLSTGEEYEAISPLVYVDTHF